MEGTENLVQTVMDTDNDNCISHSSARGSQLFAMEVGKTVECEMFMQHSMSWSSSVMSALHSMQKEGKFCDLVLKGNSGAPILAHSALLSAASSHIKSLLGETAQSVNVEFPNSPREILQALVTFVYTGKVVVSRDGVEDLMEVSKQLCIAELSSICQAWLLGMLPVVGDMESSRMEKSTQTETAESDSPLAAVMGLDMASYSAVNSPCLAEAGVPSPDMPCGVPSKQVNIKEEATLLEERTGPVPASAADQTQNNSARTVQTASEQEAGELPDFTTGRDSVAISKKQRGRKPKQISSKAFQYQDRKAEITVNQEEDDRRASHHVRTRSGRIVIARNWGTPRARTMKGCTKNREIDSPLKVPNDTLAGKSLSEDDSAVHSTGTPCKMKKAKTKGASDGGSSKKTKRRRLKMEFPIVCSFCGQTFHKLRSLRLHEHRHRGTYPHVCSICQKGFMDRDAFKNHILTHEGKSPVNLCDICGLACTSRQGLKKHRRTMHDKTPQFRCQFCEKQYLHRSSFVLHLRSHTRDVCYQCVVCQKAFLDKSSLNRHSRTHTGLKPFSCSTCGKQFTQSTSRNHHEMTAHASKQVEAAVSQKETDTVSDDHTSPGPVSEGVQVWRAGWESQVATNFQTLTASMEAYEKQDQGDMTLSETYILVTQAEDQQEGAAVEVEQMQALQCVQTSNAVSSGEMAGEMNAGNWKV